jgi:hypothetical protein
MAHETDTPGFDDQIRQAIRQAATQLTRESTSVVRLSFRSIVYYVPGRQRNGTPRSKLATALLMVPLAILWIPTAIVLGILSELGVEFHSRRTSKIFVRGKRSSQAVPFADALRDARSDVWLAWSKSQVALFTATDHHPQMLWRDTGRERPRLQVAKRKLRWPDGSNVEFDLSADEQTRGSAQRHALIIASTDDLHEGQHNTYSEPTCQ